MWIKRWRIWIQYERNMYLFRIWYESTVTVMWIKYECNIEACLTVTQTLCFGSCCKSCPFCAVFTCCTIVAWFEADFPVALLVRHLSGTDLRLPMTLQTKDSVEAGVDCIYVNKQLWAHDHLCILMYVVCICSSLMKICVSKATCPCKSNMSL